MDYLENLFSVKGKVAIVTGASRGIGHAVACGLNYAGAKVYGLARNWRTAKGLTEFNTIKCDVTQSEKLESTIYKIYKENSKIDILVNIAGVTYPENLSNDKIQTFNKTMDVNVKAAFVAINLVADYMKKRSSGSIINFTSIAAEFGFPDNPSYVASKGALKMLTKAFAEDLSRFGIRVNNIAPGYIQTDMTKNSYNDKDAYKIRLRNILLNRWGKPEDLIGATIFLASDSSSYITGIDLVVDGGWSAKGIV